MHLRLPLLILSCFHRQTTTAVLTLGLMLGLQGCVQAPIKTSTPSSTASAAHLSSISSIQTYTLNGRMGLQNNGQGFSGRLHWQHSPKRDDISLYSPFGGQVASITKTTQQVTLTDDKGRRVSAQNIETLMNKQLGWHIPVDALEDWALGRPTQSGLMPPTDTQWDSLGRLASFKQDGWAVNYKRYMHTNGYDLPSKLTLRKEGLYLKLLVNTWDIQ